MGRWRCGMRLLPRRFLPAPFLLPPHPMRSFSARSICPERTFILTGPIVQDLRSDLKKILATFIPRVRSKGQWTLGSGSCPRCELCRHVTDGAYAAIGHCELPAVAHTIHS